MSHQGFDYRVISMGVNRSEGQKPLRFAENDATAVFDTFTSALGPATTDSSFRMLGSDATTRYLAVALDYMRLAPPDYLLLYFSGHGGDDGIALANGILPYEALHNALSKVRARSILVILDACRSGNFGKFGEAVDVAGGVWESWADVLKRAMPGTRMFFAARPNENSREGNGVAAGHFTWSLVNALHQAKGTLSSKGVEFISDIDAFNMASRILKKRWPNDATPEWKGLRGDFPMLISQAATSVGTGLVYVNPFKTGYGADVTVDVHDRRGLTTEIRCHLFDASNDYIDGATFPIKPTRNIEQFHRQFTVKPNKLPKAHHRTLNSGNVSALTWYVEFVEPIHNKILDQAQATRLYWRRR